MSGILDLHVSRYAAGADMHPHRHDQAWFCLIVEGGYEERILGMRNTHLPGDLLYCPAQAEHAQRFGAKGAKKIIFAIDDHLAGLLHEHAARLDGRPLLRRSDTLLALGRRVDSELALDDPYSSSAIASMALDMLGHAARGLDDACRYEPRWLRRVRDYLHEDPSRDVSLDTLAAVAERHPVHLARSFRQFHQCTVGDYVRRLRVDQAALLLRTTRRPLLDIALDCGFAGAAQFSRSFRAVHATTPSAWRAAMR
ncbi:AraC family transcriptional regulator [Luteibacter sahnii]|uniref:AraC family transcriptional regulator n=1 Tax=Luteibacter sahnii TaxID=3021977 RepID=UPI002A6B39E9|nr:AraC family transcriptional regulator [Luteibacter sp. PPL193]MDY1547897.1 AraC family transcriptional regulator [Luteibacter sp. PPL193]